MSYPIISNQPNVVVSPDYVALLEKTDAIHGIGLALASVLIGILGVILTGATIFVAYYIWKNSKEEKEERKKIQDAYNAQLQALITGCETQFSSLVKIYEERSEEALKKLEEISVNANSTTEVMTEKKREIEAVVAEYRKKIDDVKKDRNAITTTLTKSVIPFAVQKNQLGYFDDVINSFSRVTDTMYPVRTCSSCGGRYRVNKFESNVSILSSRTVCPHCGFDIN